MLDLYVDTNTNWEKDSSNISGIGVQEETINYASKYISFLKQLQDKRRPEIRKEDTKNIQSTLWYFSSRMAAKEADRLLQIVSSDPDLNQTRCIDIAALCRKFDIEVYKNKTLPDNVSGRIFAYGTTEKLYSKQVVIINNGNESFEHRRFVTAHELGHFLFDCCGNTKYDSRNLLFDRSYQHPSSQHTTLEEKRADRFAAQLLMPKNLFRIQYVKEAQSELGKLLGREYVIDQLAKFFQVKNTSVERRIHELLEDGGF